MARKVVPGSITEPYKIGQGDFAPNLVGQQFTQGTPLFTLGNFAITTNTSARSLSNVYNTGSFSDSYTLETLNLTEQESEVLSNESLKVLLNLDPTNLERFVYFGSFYEFISSSIKSILLKWKGSLFVNPYIPTDVSGLPKNTVLNFTYDILTNESSFKIPVTTVRNKFGLLYEAEYGGNADVQQSPIFNPEENFGDIFNVNIHYKKYQVSNIFGDFFVEGFSGSTQSDPYIKLKVKGNPWPGLENIGFGVFDFHIRPKEDILNLYFFNQLNEFENQILNRLITPKYTYELQITKRTDEGNIFFSNKSFTWPTTDGYNLDNGGGEFTMYLNSWLNAAKDLDDNKTDLVARRFITASIIEFDTDGGGDEVYGRKVNKLLRIYGREFDEIKKYVDSLSFSRIVEYDKKDNAPDQIIKILASELGLDVLLSFFDNNLFNNSLPQNSSTEGYGNIQNVPFSGYSRNLSPKEMDIELWRRLVINAWWLFRSKGHRKVLEFFLNLFSIQNCVVSLDEYIYIAENAPLNVEETFRLISEIEGQLTSDSLLQADDLSQQDYPIDNYGFPKLFPNSPDYYYQLNGFWYNGGNLSEIGNNPHVGPYDYGSEYLNALRCFVSGFSGATTGITTFTTIDNLFNDYENGTIENGLPNYGDNYAELMNQNHRSTGIKINLAGSDDSISYGDSNQSFRINFSLSGEECILPCPVSYISYENGLFFIGFPISETNEPVEESNSDTNYNYINESEIPTLLTNNPNSLIEAATITENCCIEAGGYYLPIGIDENPLGTNTFTPEELFANAEDQTEQYFGCYWCPPTRVVCGLDYYNSLIGPSLKQLTTGPVGGGGGGDIKTGLYCTKPVGVPVIDQVNGYQYIIVNPPTETPPSDTTPVDPTYLTDEWTDVTNPLGQSLGYNNLFKRGLCYGVRSSLSGGNDNNGVIGGLPVDSLGPKPCAGDIAQTTTGIWTIDGIPAKAECCTQNVIGYPVTIDGNGNCVSLTATDTNECPSEFTISNGIVVEATESKCCDPNIVGFGVYWDGAKCRVVDNDFCVILSINDQNITNKECCNLKGGYLSTDLEGNVVCLQNDTSIGTEDIIICSELELLNTTQNLTYTDNGTLITTINDSNGNPLSEDCCKSYSELFNDPSFVYNPILGGCYKEELINQVACRYDLIEGFFGRISDFHPLGDLGINSLSERIYVKITKLKINGIDYLNNSVVQTIIDPSVASPDYWNSVLFLQKTFNDLGINNYKVQLPGEPININSDVPDTQGLITTNYFEGYGFYIIRPENDTFEIDIQFFTESDQPGNFNVPPGRFVFNLTENTQRLNGDFSPRVRTTECGYKVDVNVETNGDVCFTIQNDEFGQEPTQCYPYIIDGKTYV